MSEYTKSTPSISTTISSTSTTTPLILSSPVNLITLDSRNKFLDQLVYKGNPYSRPLLPNNNHNKGKFSIFPEGSVLRGVRMVNNSSIGGSVNDKKRQVGNLERINGGGIEGKESWVNNRGDRVSKEGDKSSFNSETIEEEVRRLEKSIEELKQSEESLGCFSVGTINQLESDVINLTTLIKNFNTFCQSSSVQPWLVSSSQGDKLELPSTSDKSSTIQGAELPYNSELGPISSELSISLHKYREYLDSVLKAENDLDRLYNIEKRLYRDESSQPSALLNNLLTRLEQAQFLHHKLNDIRNLMMNQ